jgi:hypothetical protein
MIGTYHLLTLKLTVIKTIERHENKVVGGGRSAKIVGELMRELCCERDAQFLYCKIYRAKELVIFYCMLSC